MTITPVESLRLNSHLDGIPLVGEILEYIYGGLDRAQLPASFSSGVTALQGCMPLLMEETTAQALIQHLGQKKYGQLRLLYQHSSLLNLFYGYELKQALEAITAVGIPVMVLKGADIATTFYPRPELRHFGDIDLMVRPEDLTATLAIFEQLGYSYHQEYQFEAISKQRVAFVYVKKVAVGHILFEIHTSPHSNEMGISFDPVQLWERARPITIAGVNVLGLGLEDLLIYLCWHYRSHFFDRLIWLYDIAIVLLRCADDLDWALVRRLARKQGLLSTVYYSMLLCELTFHISIQQNAEIELCKPPGFIHWLILCIVGGDLSSVLYRTAHEKRKLLQRLMVDDPYSLWKMLLRVVFPSPTHLGRIYMERSRLPLRLFWLYYPLHPLFLLKALLELSSKKLLRSKHTAL